MKTDTELNPNETIQKLGSLIKDIRFAMATTQSGAAEFYSCPLTTQEIEFDGNLWFVIGRHSQIAQNIYNQSSINITYSSEKSIYVSVTGYAELVDDRDKLQEFWNPSFNIWFKQGIDDPEVILLKVHVTAAE